MNPAVEIFPIAIGKYADKDLESLEVDAEVARVAELLADFGGEIRRPWAVKMEDRGGDAIDARLAEWQADAAGPTVLYWVGHGWSDTKTATLAHAGSPRQVGVRGIKPKMLADTIVRWESKATEDAWLLVVIDACRSARYAELLAAAVDDIGLGSRRRVIVLGTSADASTILGRFTGELDFALRHTFADNADIVILQLVDELQRRVRGERRILNFGPEVLLRRIAPIAPGFSGSLDVRIQLNGVIRDLPDDERRHFLAKAQGGELRTDGDVLGELTWHFTGRTRERRAIVSKLGRDGMIVVTGHAGSGKSALLGDILVRSRPPLAKVLLDHGLLAPAAHEPPLPFDSAVHLTGLSAGQLISRICADLELDTVSMDQSFTSQLDEFERLVRSKPGRSQVLVDALDEAVVPLQVAAVLRRLGAVSGVCLVVGTRRSTLEGPDQPDPEDADLLDALECPLEHTILIERDPDAAFDYVRRRLSALVRTSRVTAAEVEAVARAVAGVKQEFLYARLATYELLARPELVRAANLIQRLGADYRAVFAAAVDRLSRENAAYQPLLRALAVAKGRGAPIRDGVWSALASAIAGYTVPEGAIHQLVDAAAPFLAIDSDHGQTVYHLAHRTFAEHFVGDSQLIRIWQDQIVRRAITELEGANVNPYWIHHTSAHCAELQPSPVRAAVLRALEVLRDSSITDRASYVALAGMIEGDQTLQSTDLSEAGWAPRWVFWSNRATGDFIVRLQGRVKGLELRKRYGRTVVLACGGRQVVAFDLADGLVLWSMGLETLVSSMAVSADGSVLAVALDDGTLVGLESDHGEEMWRFSHGDEVPHALAVEVLDDRCVVATGTYNEGLEARVDLPLPQQQVVRTGVIRIWAPGKTRTRIPVWKRDVFGSGVQDLHFIPLLGQPRLLAAGDPYKEPETEACILRILDLDTGELVKSLQADVSDQSAAAVLAHNNVFAATAHHILRWRPSTGQLDRERNPAEPGRPQLLAAALHRGRSLIVMNNNRELVLVDGETLQRRNERYTTYEAISALAILDGESIDEPAVLITGSFEGDIRAWSIDRLLTPGRTTLARVARADVQKSTNVLIAMIDHPPASVEIRDLGDGRLIHSQDLRPTAVRATPNAEQVLLGFRDGNIEARRLPNLSVVWSRRVHTFEVRDLRISGDTVVSVGWDHTLRLSSLADGRELRSPVHVPGWEDKGLTVVEVLDGEKPDEVIVVVGGGLSFGLAAWNLETLPHETGWESIPQMDIRASDVDSLLVRQLHFGQTPVLACADTQDGAVRLIRLTVSASYPPDPPDEVNWAAHRHTITAIAQLGRTLWTSDSRGYVRFWTSPQGWNPTQSPQLQGEIQLRTNVVEVFPLKEDAVLIATDSGLVRIDIRQP